MIKFTNVSKSYPLGKSRKLVLDNITARFQPGVDTGILGHNGAGKSTLFRLLSGSEPPDRGQVDRSSSVSWPLGFTGGFHGSLTARENVRFVSRIYGRSGKEVFDYVEDFAELGSYIDLPVKAYSSGMRARLAFGLSMAMQFDYYLIDEVIAVGDTRFKRKCRHALKERRKQSTILIISHSESIIRDYCRSAFILNKGKLEFYENVDEALEQHEKNQSDI